MTDKFIELLNIERTDTFTKLNEFLNNMITPITDQAKRYFFTNLLEHNIMGSNGKLTRLGKLITQIRLTTVNYNLKKC